MMYPSSLSPRPVCLSPESLGSLLKRAGENRLAPSSVLPVDAYNIWKNVIGPQFAPHALPIGLFHDNLLIRVTSHAWATELSFISPLLIEELNKNGIKVRDIKFLVGPIPPSWSIPFRLRPYLVKRRSPLPDSFDRELMSVENEEFRAILKEAICCGL
ncbi:DciA family protein [Pajaroellobacter abortibovis]|uniref:DUF721 domain-containing protein n=1 Tax=Pajaroellobacter abortibovis TaxID=1882918 RepID=A0A1L6MWW2_9BACT|nr:DUF721 domain-containing protein [Pajaroellobacter abortibovis]APS00040.1 hypothetical protein BCY86_04590 [Pajaroellobacter abortibovis]